MLSQFFNSQHWGKLVKNIYIYKKSESNVSASQVQHSRKRKNYHAVNLLLKVHFSQKRYSYKSKGVNVTCYYPHLVWWSGKSLSGNLVDGSGITSVMIGGGGDHGGCFFRNFYCQGDFGQFYGNIFWMTFRSPMLINMFSYGKNFLKCWTQNPTHD